MSDRSSLTSIFDSHSQASPSSPLTKICESDRETEDDRVHARWVVEERKDWMTAPA